MLGGVGCRAGGMCIRFVWGLSAWRAGVLRELQAACNRWCIGDFF